MLRLLDCLLDESLPAGFEGIAACLDDGMMAWITRAKPNADPIEIVYTNRPTRNCYGLVTVSTIPRLIYPGQGWEAVR